MNSSKINIFFFLLLALSFGCGKPITNKKPTDFSKDDNASTLNTNLEKIQLLGTSMTINFHQLPLDGEIKDHRKYWSGDYWQHNKGSINLRWYSTSPVGFNLSSPARAEAAAMDPEQLKALSPAEKYDLLLGRYDYPLKKIISSLARPNAKDWEGLCHGWAPASLNHKEPEPKSLFNPQGIEIPFGSSDIKALLTYYYASNNVGETHQIGKRCYKEVPGSILEAEVLDEKDSCDDDLDPSVFHIVLANKIGLQAESFLADMDRYKEVWNHPIVTFSSKVLKEVQQGNSKILTLRTTIFYVDEIQDNSWNPTIGTSNHVTTNKVYEYEIEIEGDGKIVAGKWLSDDRPDFLWVMQKPATFEGYLSKINDLLRE